MGSKSELLNLASKEQNDFNLFNKKIDSLRASGISIPLKIELGSRQAYLYSINENGVLEYVGSHNIQAAASTATRALQQNAGYAMDLTGAGMVVGVWEADVPNTSHSEFQNRVEQKDNPVFSQGNHATHVIGTVAASGINPDAKGMATQVRVNSYDASQDNSEIATEAANGLLLSNHSYGLLSGWDQGTWYGDPSVSQVEDYKFGFYNSGAATWDDIAYKAPYYLIVKSAGNDRGDAGNGRPSDGPYDCVSTHATAKNILTVGAVNELPSGYNGPSSVVMSSFSSWGPTDDGRIKPDIVGNGVNVFSSFSTTNTSYGSLQGTSMSSPNVTGSLVLLQQYHHQIHGKYMLSATLKALVIHTAEESGIHSGPDYEFGWGLLNTQKAAKIISKSDHEDFLMIEDTLEQQQVKEFYIDFKGEPISVTLVWTDPAATPSAISLNPRDPKLINDLDVRLVDIHGNIVYPWVLDPAEPANAATQGDNFRDNVERINLYTPVAGTYKILISHKANLVGGRQNFSLIATNRPALTEAENKAFFWIGNNNSNWQTGAAWSLSQSGPTANSIPASASPVVFYSQLGEPSDTLFINATADIEIGALSAYGSRKTKINLNGNKLIIDGSFYCANPNFIISNGEVLFRGSTLKNNVINIISGAPFERVGMSFESSNAKWSLIGNLSAKTISINNSSFYAKDIHITSKSLLANEESKLNFIEVDLIDIERIEYYQANFQKVNYYLENLEDTAHFKHKGNGVVNLNLVNLVSANSNFEGLFEIQKLQLLASEVNFIDPDQDLDTLLMEASTLKIKDKLSINRLFSTSGEATNSIISNNASPATIFSESSRRFCLGTLIIDNVSAAGGTIFSADPLSELLGTANGWELTKCSELLFSDFEVHYPCTDGYISFLSLSTGSPDHYQWMIKKDNQTIYESNQSSFGLRIAESGNHQVFLKVSTDQKSDSIIRVVNIQKDLRSVLNKPNILLRTGQLSSSISAPQYLWLLNGNPIENSNKRTITPLGDGDYQVIVTDSYCQYISDAYPVTVLSVNDNLLKSVVVSPNPNSGVFEILFENKSFQDLRIIDATSREVPYEILESNEKRIKVKVKQKGLIILKIGIENEEITKKIIVE